MDWPNILVPVAVGVVVGIIIGAMATLYILERVYFQE